MAKQQLFIGVLNERAGYVDGGVYIGLYDGENKDAAKQKMIEIQCDRLGQALADEQFRKKLADNITMVGVNERPVQIIVHRSNYKG